MELLVQETLYAVKQPIISLTSGRPRGYEFLSRSTVPGYSPDKYLGETADLGCLRNCLKAARTLAPGLRRHVNLHPSTLLSVPPDEIVALFPAGAYCVELNENLLEFDPRDLRPAADALRAAGILLAIDDVGFGRSSLEALIHLEPDILKVDKALITGASRDPQRLRALSRLLRLCSSLEAETVLEGIETAEDLSAVMDLGALYGQGYFWGKPA
jgi:EAL domain-containing protein (putative c-di-GMP-specific phosphodiesterase class I)